METEKNKLRALEISESMTLQEGYVFMCVEYLRKFFNNEVKEVDPKFTPEDLPEADRLGLEDKMTGSETRAAVVRYERVFKKIREAVESAKETSLDSNFQAGIATLQSILDFKKHVLWGSVVLDSDRCYSIQSGENVKGYLIMVPPGHFYLKDFNAIARFDGSQKIVEIRPDAVSDTFAAAVLCYALDALRQFADSVPAQGTEQFYELYANAYIAELFVLELLSGGKLGALVGRIIKDRKARFGSIDKLLDGFYLKKEEIEFINSEIFSGQPKSDMERTGRNAILLNAIAFDIIARMKLPSEQRRNAIIAYMKDILERG